MKHDVFVYRVPNSNLHSTVLIDVLNLMLIADGHLEF